MKCPDRIWKKDIAWGDAGIKQTLDVMVSLVRKDFLLPIVRLTTLDVVSNCDRLDEGCHLQSIHDYVVENVHYILEGEELLQSPEYMLHNILSGEMTYGDCDDGSMLIAAMGMSIGYPARFVAISNSSKVLGGPIQHVFTELKTSHGWTALDFTEKEPYHYGDKRSIVREI